MKRNLEQAKKIAFMVLGGIPFVASAQSSNGGLGSLRDIINGLVSFVSGNIFPILITLAIIVFLWNVIQFIGKLDNPEERKKFRKYTINAVVALFVIFSLWGIIAIGTGIFFNSGPFIPQLPTQAQ